LTHPRTSPFLLQCGKLTADRQNKHIRDLYRGINEFKKGYQPGTNLVQDDSGDLLADFYNILNKWKNCFPQLLNVHKVSNVMQIEIHTAELLVPEANLLETEIAVAKLENYNSPGSEQIWAELIQAGCEILCS
jgi:hypothetical protein